MNWIFKNKKMPCEKSTSDFFCKLKNILRNKKRKTILVVLVLMCVFCLGFSTAHAETKVTTFIANGLDFVTGFGTAGPLYLVQVAIGIVFVIETALFAAIVDPNTLSGTGGILNQQGVQDVWIMVRDLLNMFFILVLLFSAFCTIFQIDKWNLKKLWLNILINALLVNFSWPIARFFIDVSNVAMYYFMNNMFTSVNGSSEVAGSTIFATILGLADVTNIIHPFKFAASGVSGQLISVIFSFLFAVTLGIIAILFVIRLVALTILLIFSPIGFVGYIFPAASSLADKWWKQLFSNAFFGPIMMLGLVISIKLMKAFQDSTFNLFSIASYTNASEGGPWIAKIAFSVVPIVVLWATMGVAKSMGAAGADTIVGGAQGLAKKFGKWAVKSAWNATGIPGGVKKGWEEARKKGTIFGKPVPLLKDNQPSREAGISGFMSGGRPGMDKARDEVRRKENRENIEKGAKDHTASGDSAAALSHITNTTAPSNKENKITIAKASSAYLSTDSDERRRHSKDTMFDPISGVARGAGDYGDHTAALTTLHASLTGGTPEAVAYLKQQAEAEAAARRIKAGTATGKDHKDFAAFLNIYHKLNIKQGVNSG